MEYKNFSQLAYIIQDIDMSKLLQNNGYLMVLLVQVVNTFKRSIVLH